MEVRSATSFFSHGHVTSDAITQEMIFVSVPHGNRMLLFCVVILDFICGEVL